MSTQLPLSATRAIYSGASETEWDLVADYRNYYTPTHTRRRPPFLNERNLSYSHVNGPAIEQSLVHGLQSLGLDGTGPYALSSYSGKSSNTDTTLKGDTNGDAAVVPEHLLFHLTRVYDGSAQPLTEDAIKALNREYSAGACAPGDINGWLQGNSPGYQQPLTTDLSTRRVQGGHSQSHATTGTTTGSSWTFVTAGQSHIDRTAEGVCAVGLQFDDIAAPCCDATALSIDENMSEGMRSGSNPNGHDDPLFI
jgi:hypothetical protein